MRTGQERVKPRCMRSCLALVATGYLHCSAPPLLLPAQILGDDVSENAHHVRLMVNWLHAASHDTKCQLQNSGRHKDGTGWTVGEQIKQLWALLTVGAVGASDARGRRVRGRSAWVQGAARCAGSLPLLARLIAMRRLKHTHAHTHTCARARNTLHLTSFLHFAEAVLAHA